MYQNDKENWWADYSQESKDLEELIFHKFLLPDYLKVYQNDRENWWADHS